jgi:hypothetical protein
MFQFALVSTQNCQFVAAQSEGINCYFNFSRLQVHSGLRLHLINCERDSRGSQVHFYVHTPSWARSEKSFCISTKPCRRNPVTHTLFSVQSCKVAGNGRRRECHTRRREAHRRILQRGANWRISKIAAGQTPLIEMNYKRAESARLLLLISLLVKSEMRFLR